MHQAVSIITPIRSPPIFKRWAITSGDPPNIYPPWQWIPIRTPASSARSAVVGTAL